MSKEEPRILVVDDYVTMRKIIRSLLMEFNYTNVEDVEDGVKALEIMRARPPELVISDWNMEPITGIELLKQVRADSRLRSIPFLMVIAESKTDSAAAALQAGANDYLVKPFNARTLHAKIESALKHKTSASP